MDRGSAPESAHHSESSGTDAGRQRVLTEMPGFRELGISLHSDTPADVMESLIKELPRLIPLQNQVARFGVSELVPLQLAYGIGVPCAPNPVYYQMLHH
jgi:hypothetical protein